MRRSDESATDVAHHQRANNRIAGGGYLLAGAFSRRLFQRDAYHVELSPGTNKNTIRLVLCALVRLNLA